MNTNLHKYLLEPRNTLNMNVLLSRLSRISRLKMNSALSTQNSELGAFAWLKEIQR